MRRQKHTVENFAANSVFQGKVKKIIQYIQPVTANTAKFLVWENTARKKLHPLELTSKVTTEFAYNRTSRGLYKERYCRIEVISAFAMHVEDVIGTEQNAML